jgi:hypothetical protein
LRSGSTLEEFDTNEVREIREKKRRCEEFRQEIGQKAHDWARRGPSITVGCSTDRSSIVDCIGGHHFYLRSEVDSIAEEQRRMGKRWFPAK